MCTYNLKTEPFSFYLQNNFPREKKMISVKEDCTIYYGFDANEMHRVQRRVGILLNMGYKSDYPLALWGDRTIFSTKEIGIEQQYLIQNYLYQSIHAPFVVSLGHWV